MIEKMLKQDNDKLIALTELNIIIDDDMFKQNLAVIDETSIRTIGFIKIFSGKHKYQLTLPLDIKLNNIDSYKDDKTKALVLVYKANDVICDNLNYYPHVKMTTKFLNMLTTSKINVPPEIFSDSFINSMRLNDVNISVPSELVEAMMSEMIRDASNESIPYRLAINKDKNAKMTIARLKDLPRLTSVFSGIAFEDIKTSLRYALLMSRKDEEQQVNPIEGVLKY